MSKIKFKLITGFRENQYYTIDADEAHKAYYLFLNPEKRGVFENGVAIIGKNIQSIQPDWNAILDYNPDYELDYEDWNELRRNGLEELARKALKTAKDIAEIIESDPKLLNRKLGEIAKEKDLLENKSQFKNETGLLSDKFSI